MTSIRGAGLAFGFLAALAGGVAVATLAIVSLVVPASAIGGLTATSEPSFDIAAAPQAVGGQLTVEGDRTGTLVLDRATGIGGRYEEHDGVITIRLAEDAILQGSDGRIRFSRSTGEVRQIDYDDLSFYLDSGECAVSHGAINEAKGLMAALIECPEIVDIRGNGTISITGVVALPVGALRGRGDMPPSGGSVEADGATLKFSEVELFDTGPPEGSGRIQLAIFNDDFTSGIQLEYDAEADRYFLGATTHEEESAVLAEPCPITADELGRIDDLTRVVRLDIDCTDVPLVDGGTSSVTGTILADIIGPFTEVEPGP